MERKYIDTVIICFCITIIMFRFELIGIGLDNKAVNTSGPPFTNMV